nr:phage integrase N-terminal SAM-like domain-containing protein [Luteolibacter marinus]
MQKPGFAMLLGWLEKFVASHSLQPGREACQRFWREQVQTKARERWQLEQWGEAVRWYLRWLEHREASGGETRSLEGRVRDAVERAGTRRGLAPRTRECYGRWAASYARWAGSAREMMAPERAAEFLAWKVMEEEVSYATQKLGLNALVFFFKAVCGLDEVHIPVKMRKTSRRVPVVLDVAEVMQVLDRIDRRYGLMAKIQYGCGLRLMELVRLRVKDIDEKRGILTVRDGKGNKDCPRFQRRPAVSRGAPPRPWMGRRCRAVAVDDHAAGGPAGRGGGEESGSARASRKGPVGWPGRRVVAGSPAAEVPEGWREVRMAVSVPRGKAIAGSGKPADPAASCR